MQTGRHTLLRQLWIIILTLPLGTACAQTPLSPAEQELLRRGLVDIQQVDPSILVHLAYSTTNNFLGRDVYGDLNRAYLQPEAAARLSQAQKLLSSKKPGYRLLVYDALRPRRVQWLMWDLVRGTDSQAYVADPSRGSIHNYGCAVDLTVTDSEGVPLDMGTPFDYFGPEAQPRHEQTYLDAGRLSPQQVSNRLLLRQVMLDAGFLMIQNEWWHFNAFSNQEVKSRYTIIE